MSGVSIVWEDTDGCAKQYRCYLDIYLSAVISSSYGIITDHSIIAPYHGKSVVDILNETEKLYSKGIMEIIGKLGSKDTTKIIMLPSASKYAFIKLADQFIHVINNKERLNRLKGRTKMYNRESLFKYQ